MKLKLLLALTMLTFSSSVVEAQTETAATIPVASPTISSAWIASNAPVSAYRLAATSGAIAGFFMVFDAKTVPVDGPVVPLFCRPMPANSNVSMTFTSPARFRNGLVLAFSSTGCYVKTASATAYFEASPK